MGREEPDFRLLAHPESARERTVTSEYACYAAFAMRYSVHIVAFLGLAVATAEAQTQLYNVIDLGDLGGLSSSAAGINAVGIATGSVTTFNAAANTYYPTAVAFNGHSITGVGTLPLGAINFSYGTAINIWGQIVGSSTGLSGGTTVQHASLFTPGKGMSDLGVLLNPALTTAATGINFWGHVVGYAFDGTNYSSWLYNGSIRTLASAQQLGASQAVAINDTGRVLVHLFPSQGGSLCYVWIDGVMVKLPVTPTCVPAAISNAGYVTGDLYPGNYAHAFSYKLGAAMPSDLGTLAPGNASAQSHGYSVNDSGVIVGTSIATNGSNHAFVYASGTMTDLNAVIPQGTVWAYLESATGINPSGQITGSGWIHTQGGSGACAPGGDCAMHAFRLNPSE